MIVAINCDNFCFPWFELYKMSLSKFEGQLIVIKERVSKNKKKYLQLYIETPTDIVYGSCFDNIGSIKVSILFYKYSNLLCFSVYHVLFKKSVFTCHQC